MLYHDISKINPEEFIEELIYKCYNKDLGRELYYTFEYKGVDIDCFLCYDSDTRFGELSIRTEDDYTIEINLTEKDRNTLLNKMDFDDKIKFCLKAKVQNNTEPYMENE